MRRTAWAWLVLLGCGASPEEHETEHEGEHEGEVRIAPSALESAGVRVGAVERRALTGGAGLPAEMRFDPLSTAHVSPLVPGRFARVEVRLGDRVEQSQLLATIASSDVSQARSQLGQAQARMQAAQTALDRQRQLVGEGIGSQRALIEAEAEVAGLRAEAQGLQRQLGVLGSGRGGELRLEAPIAGVVVQMHATPGETAAADDPAFTIADPSAISVYGEVPELAVGRVREGLATIFRPHAFPDLALGGTIQYVAPAIDPETRSLTIRVALDHTDPRLRSGMFGSLELVGDERRPLAIPTDAVVTLDGQPTVFVPGDEAGAFRPLTVQIGRRAGRFYELRGGLAEGAPVVVAGAFTLKSALRSEELAEHED